MPTNQNASSHSASISTTRHPIFDPYRRLWGYELVCSGEEQYAQSDSCALESTAISVAASAYMGLQRIMKQVQKIVVNFDEASILDDMPYALPPIITVVQLDEPVFLRPDIPRYIERLKLDGYLIAVRHFSGEQQFDPLYKLADIIAVPVVGKPKKEIMSLLTTIQDTGAELLARHVDDALTFALCREAGITLFEGALFKRPDTIVFRKMVSNEVARLELLQRIEQQNPDIDGLAETIQSDAAISFRLLTYLNSPAFGFTQQIKSIHHAIRLLGWQRLKNWLRVVLHNDMSQATELPEVLQRSAQRGKFLELVVRSHDFWGFDPESLHLLGLFSRLDAMLGIPMADIVAFLPIENKLKGALRRDTNNEYLPLIQLAECVESPRCEDADVMIQQLNLNRKKVTAAVKAASQWAHRLLAMGD